MKPNALLIDPSDNVVTLLRRVPEGGAVIWIVDGDSVVARQEIPAGHKAAIKAIATGSDVLKYAYPIGTAGEAIAPGNQEGGLSSIQEKSLGCIRKGGSSAIQEVLEYAERPTQRGLCVMNTPGSDIFSITGMIAGGAQIVLFTTGRGSPAGSPIAPVVKVASNTQLFEAMPEDMDFDAGRIASGMSLERCGAELVVSVASGPRWRLTRRAAGPSRIPR